MALIGSATGPRPVVSTGVILSSWLMLFWIIGLAGLAMVVAFWGDGRAQKPLGTLAFLGVFVVAYGIIGAYLAWKH